MRRLSIAALTVFLLGSSAAVATACPLCKFGNESKQSADEPVNMRPRAYMYSILFMLAMPASMATALGIGIYKMSRHEQNITGLDSVDVAD
jgi:hypothetical protein